MSELILVDGSISGQLSSSLTMSATLEPVQSFTISSKVDSLASLVEGTYSESYELISSLDEDIIIETKNKLLKDDIVIKKINYSETTNESGGSTLYIGD